MIEALSLDRASAHSCLAKSTAQLHARRALKCSNRVTALHFTPLKLSNQRSSSLSLAQRKFSLPPKNSPCRKPFLRCGIRAATGSGMQDQGGAIMREVLNREGRSKLDLKDDRTFYGFPRLVKHVDDQFLSTLTKLYRQRIPAGGEVLDLMSSWVSHLPPEVKYKRVIGHGMNAAELAKNPRLDSFFVKNLNEEPKLEASDCSFDAVLICVSVQYSQQPEKVFAEIFRVLKPGGLCIVSFSNRMFYEKAIASWREGSGYSRVQLVKQYFSCIRGFTQPETVTELPKESAESSSQNQNIVQKFFKLFQRAGSDPFYAVISYRNFKATS